MRTRNNNNNYIKSKHLRVAETFPFSFVFDFFVLEDSVITPCVREARFNATVPPEDFGVSKDGSRNSGILNSFKAPGVVNCQEVP